MFVGTPFISLAADPQTIPGKIEAESYTSQTGWTGSITETCTDTGGGQDVGWTAAGNTMNYPATITVYASSDRPPVMSAIPSCIVEVGKLVSFTIKATDPDTGDVLTYSTIDLPVGASFNPTTKKFSWAPTVAGTYAVQFVVSDGQLTDSKTATIIVQ